MSGLLESYRRQNLQPVSDIDEKITKEISKKYKVPGFVDSGELLESGLVDAVLIATPHYFHPPSGISAMEEGSLPFGKTNCSFSKGRR